MAQQNSAFCSYLGTFHTQIAQIYHILAALHTIIPLFQAHTQLYPIFISSISDTQMVRDSKLVFMA